MASARWLGLSVALAGLLAGCETTSQPDPMQVKLDDVDQRLGRVERVVSNQSLLQLSQRIDVMDAQVRELRGTVEELQNSNETLRKQQRDLYADLDRRIGVLEKGQGAGAPPPASADAGGAGAAAPGSASAASNNGDQAAYGKAFDALKSGDYPSAITQFQGFLRSYPQSSLDDNAQYWLGEAYYVTRDYDNAAAAFSAVGSQYPQSRKAADALLKLGYTQYEQKRLTDARATLGAVVQRYPGTDAAKLAADRLQKLPPSAQ